MSRSKIHFLSVEDYEHPWDVAARNTLNEMPGFTAIISKLNEIGFDRLLRIQYTGSSLKVTPTNLPELYDTLQLAGSLLSIQPLPELYLQMDYKIGAFTAGVEKPIVVLNAGTIEFLSSDELLYVVAHELGHIKNKHVLYHQTASYLPMMVNLIGNATLGILPLLTSGIQIALLNWSRMSELTADRAGLLACQDPEVAATALIKIAGLPRKYHGLNLVKEFIQQAKEFESYSFDMLDQIAKVVSVSNRSHPWTVMRAAELFKWVESGEYSRIVEKQDWKSSQKLLPAASPSVPRLPASGSSATSTKPWREG